MKALIDWDEANQVFQLGKTSAIARILKSKLNGNWGLTEKISILQVKCLRKIAGAVIRGLTVTEHGNYRTIK